MSDTRLHGFHKLYHVCNLGTSKENMLLSFPSVGTDGPPPLICALPDQLFLA